MTKKLTEKMKMKKKNLEVTEAEEEEKDEEEEKENGENEEEEDKMTKNREPPQCPRQLARAIATTAEVNLDLFLF